MSLFDFEGKNSFYERQGSGDPIAFLPTATLTGKRWEFQADYFKNSHDVGVVDLPDDGASQPVASRHRFC